MDEPCQVCTPEECRRYVDRVTLEHTGMTGQEYERFMCGCPACDPDRWEVHRDPSYLPPEDDLGYRGPATLEHTVPCTERLCVQCRMDWFAPWRCDTVVRYPDGARRCERGRGHLGAHGPRRDR